MLDREEDPKREPDEGIDAEPPAEGATRRGVEGGAAEASACGSGAESGMVLHGAAGRPGPEGWYSSLRTGSDKRNGNPWSDPGEHRKPLARSTEPHSPVDGATGTPPPPLLPRLAVLHVACVTLPTPVPAHRPPLQTTSRPASSTLSTGRRSMHGEAGGEASTAKRSPADLPGSP
jgi:hypothetical protein